LHGHCAAPGSIARRWSGQAAAPPARTDDGAALGDGACAVGDDGRLAERVHVAQALRRAAVGAALVVLDRVLRRG